MLKVGLTGSIAVGKSFVDACFRALGCHVLDADQTSREVVAPGTEGLRRVVNAFGHGILAPDGSLDRKKLASIIFADKEKRKLLNAIVHPLVIDAQEGYVNKREKEDPKGIVIVDAALMIESGGYKRFDEIVIVWCEPEIQLKRLMFRDKLGEADAQNRINAQMSQEEKKNYANRLIDTSRGIEDTCSQVVAIHNRWRSKMS